MLENSRSSVVILRFRGVDQLGLSMIDVLKRYAADLQRQDSTLKLVVGSDTALRQIESEGLVVLLGHQHVYSGNQWLDATVRPAYSDAWADVQDQPTGGDTP